MSIGPSKTRLVVVVVEGLPKSYLKFVKSQFLDHSLHRLLNRGAMGILESLFVPNDAASLATALSGVGPGEHNIYSMWDENHLKGLSRSVLSDDFKSKWVWEREGEDEQPSVALMNLLSFYPPKKVKGSAVAQIYERKQRHDNCFPKSLLKDLKHGNDYHDMLSFFQGSPLRDYLTRLFRIASNQIALFEKQVQEGHTLNVCYLSHFDKVAHFFGREMHAEPDSPLLFELYEHLSHLLNQLAVWAVEQDMNFMLLSNCGSGVLDSYVSVNDYLARCGYLKWEVPKLVVDKENSLAYESIQGTHGVVLNEKYFSAAQADEVLEALVKMPNPETGKPFLRQALRRDELYMGDYMKNAPSFILDPYDESYLPYGDPFWADKTNRGLQSGWHRREGVVCVQGPAFQYIKASDFEDQNHRLCDVAPTILDCLGIEKGGALEGRSFLHSLSEDSLEVSCVHSGLRP